MKDLMSKLAGKSSEKPMDDHAEAKMKVLEELRDMALGMMKDKLPKGEMHGVEIMAPDKEGLKKGLDLAKEALPEAELAESESEESEEEMSPEEIDAMIAELQAKKAALKA